MTMAPWRSPLARALHRNRSRAYSRYPQLATVRSDGRPANRTVVFRDFAPASNSLLFITDQRSAKIEQLTHHPYGELCWYFTQTREQFRLSGHLQIIHAQTPQPAIADLRHAVWAKLSDNARQQFSWPQPGQPRVTDGYAPTPDLPEPPPDTFAVLVFDPDAVDHLELRGDPQNRYQYERQPDHTWQMRAVNP